jgi:2-polyprenyl-3-methyl-5-hydroxy-6-metoxy-1,4-benzoquinol methylase
MTPGQFARKILGRRFQPVGDAYRRLFVDLTKIVEFLDQEIPAGATILDIGGGDGAVVARLLDRRPDLSVTMCDLAPEVGAFLSEGNRTKVTPLPGTKFTEVTGEFDVVTISDVVHHVPINQRHIFFQSLAQSCARWGCRRIILKDIEPRGLRALMARFTDRHITGDRHVVPFSRSDFRGMAHRYFPAAKGTGAMPDWPNYCEVLSW